MTAKKDLKRRVRARQAETGGRYTEALQAVRAQAAAANTVIELCDVSGEAAALGWKTKAALLPRLAARTDGAMALRPLRDALLVASDDARTAAFRAVLLRGQAPAPADGTLLERLAHQQRFLARVRAGLGGVSDSGRALAMDLDIGGRATVIYVLFAAEERAAALDFLTPDEQRANAARYPGLLAGLLADFEALQIENLGFALSALAVLI